MLRQLKILSKCFIVLVTAIVVDTFLGHILMLIMIPLLVSFGKVSTIIGVVIGTIGMQLFIASLVIGVFGGKFIGGKPHIGFALSGIYYLCYLAIAITEHQPGFDLLTFLMFLGLPLVVIVGRLVYKKSSKSDSVYN